MSKYYQNLFEKFLNRNISPQELEDLLNWINENENFNDVEVLKKIWVNLEKSEAIDGSKAARIQHKLQSRIRQHESNKRAKIRKWTSHWPRVAAAIVLLIVCGLGYYLNTPVVIKADFGEIVEVVLPDHSVVRLNANSQISYPRLWNRQDVRNLSLDGEAFFEVSKDLKDHKKFIVHTKDLSVEVLGTVFNVNARNKSTKVFLESGSVKLNALNREGFLMMEPGEEAGFDDNGELAKLKINNPLNHADWKDGSMTLKDKALAEILREFEIVFGQKYHVEDEVLLNQSFTIVFPITDEKKSLEILQNLVGQSIIMDRN
ncbi:FecR family protein [Membranihabitans marinus]|uniref:FecR family protein n=1 Tax=Membranihabitans marinus TaxID=1227546 RepID=UPI001F34E212|nr:FecR family protein [Membranihabitans marinus]